MGPEESRVLFAQLVEERNLLKQQIALLEQKLSRQNETLQMVYRERDELRERFRREQRQSNQLKRALESVVERAADNRTPLVATMDFMSKVASTVEAGMAPRKLDAPSADGTEDCAEDSNPTDKPPEKRSLQISEAIEPGKFIPEEPHRPAPVASGVSNNVVLLRPLAEPLPLSPAATRVLESQSESDSLLEPSPDLAKSPVERSTKPSSPQGRVAEGSPEESIEELVAEAIAMPLNEISAAPNHRFPEEAAPAPVLEPQVVGAQAEPRPSPMLPPFASRGPLVGVKFLSENLPPEREANRRRPNPLKMEPPEAHYSERPERPVGAQVAAPPFWQDLQKSPPPKSMTPRKRVTAFAAIQLPNFPPLR